MLRGTSNASTCSQRRVQFESEQLPQDSDAEARELAPLTFLRRKTQSPCCCCALPRWAQWSACAASTYLGVAAFLMTIGQFLFYPGDFNRGEVLPSTLHCSHVRLRNARETTGIHCLFGSPAASSAPIFVVGGNAMNAYDSMATMPFLLRGDFEAFSMSLPGSQYGGSDPISSIWHTEENALEDATALLKYVHNRTGKAAVVFGWSIGSSIAAYLASGDKQVRCVILGNPFSSMRDEAMAFSYGIALPWLYLVSRWPTVEWAADIQVPAIVLSSGSDQVIPEEQHLEVYTAIADRDKLLLEKPRASHMDMEAFFTDLRAAFPQKCG